MHYAGRVELCFTISMRRRRLTRTQCTKVYPINAIQTRTRIPKITRASHRNACKRVWKKNVRLVSRRMATNCDKVDQKEPTKDSERMSAVASIMGQYVASRQSRSSG